MTFPFYHVDAFTGEAFGGNQAGVCLLEEPLPKELMQEIAAENNVAETAFVRKSGLRKSDFKRVREAHIKYLKRQHGIEQRKIKRRKLGHTVVENLTSLRRAKA